MSRPHRFRLLVGSAAGLHEFGAFERRYFEGHEVTALARDESRWWALVDGQSIRATRLDRGWEEVAGLQTGAGTCLAWTPYGLLVGTAGAHLFRLAEGRLVRVDTFERVESRQEWYTPWGDPPDTRSISAAPRGAVYVNVHVGGVVRSTDGGQSWRPTLDIEADVHQVLCHPGREGFVLAAAAIGLGISEDGGETWGFEAEGLHAHYLRAVAAAGDSVFVSASTGPRGERAAIYRRRLGKGGRFERCTQGLPDWFGSNIDTFCLASSGTIAAFGTDEGFVGLSTDGGTSWQPIGKGLPAVRCIGLI